MEQQSQFQPQQLQAPTPQSAHLQHGSQISSPPLPATSIINGGSYVGSTPQPSVNSTTQSPVYGSDAVANSTAAVKSVAIHGSNNSYSHSSRHHHSHSHHAGFSSSPPVIQPMTLHHNSSTNANIGAVEAMSSMSLNGAPMPFHSTSPSPESHGTAGSSIYSDSAAEESLFDSNRGHVQDTERIAEIAGPNSQYAKLNTILGRGAYKTVWKALDREEGIEVAWNIIETAKNDYSELVQETEILKKVRHPNVIHFYDSWYTNGEFIFITELMTSGTLREYIKKFKNPSMKIIKRWSRQILKGLNYLHSQSPPIIHRDIKCDNIFINGSHGEVKIGDMGTAKMKFGKKYTVIGTPEFMAPEMYEEKGYSEKVDIYAFGMCLLEMVTGEYPYNECKNAAQIYKKVSQGIKPECLIKVDDKDVLGIILNCLAPENERWSARKLLEHPFFAEDPDVSLLSVDDSKTKLTFQVVFKGSDKQTVKFGFNTEKDTAENVVNEMIEEHILSSKFRQFVTASIHKILRDLIKNVGAPDDPSGASGSAAGRPPPPVPPRVASNAFPLAPLMASSSSASLPQPVPKQPAAQSIVSPLSDVAANAVPLLSASSLPISSINVNGSAAPTGKITLQSAGASTTKKTLGPEAINYDFEPMARDYPNDFPIEDFVSDVATSCNRDAEKANEWLSRLKNQDIMTVGDLRDLHEDDWSHLNLTVFASRAFKNGLLGSTRKPFNPISPRLSAGTATSPGAGSASGAKSSSDGIAVLDHVPQV